MCRNTLLNTAFLVGLMTAAHAADVSWDGGGDGTTLDDALNWAGNTLPNGSVPDVGLFDGSDPGPLSLEYSGAVNLGDTLGMGLRLAPTQTEDVRIDSGGNVVPLRLGNVTVAGGAGALTLGDGSDVFNIVLGSLDGEVHAWTNDSSSPATVGSDVSLNLGSAGSHGLLFSGAGDWVVDASLTPSTTGLMSIQKTGAGELRLGGGGSLVSGIASFGGNFSAVLKEGTTRIVGGAYDSGNTEFTVGGLDPVGTDTQLVMDSGTLANVSWLSIGRGNGSGATSSDVILNNNASISAVNLSMGFNGGNAATASAGAITANDSSVLNVTTNVYISESGGSNMTLNLNDSSVFNQTNTGAGVVRIGMGASTQGAVNVAGGTMNVERDLVVGYDGSGSVVLDSGTVNVATSTERWLIVGQRNGGNGSLTINGGDLNLNANTDLRLSTEGSAAGSNTVNLNGGGITGYSGNQSGGGINNLLDLKRSGGAGVVNQFNLNGGTLTIGQVMTTANTGTVEFNFNGGTLVPGGNHANFIDLGGATQSVNVREGGAVIDTSGFDVTIVDQLQSTGGDGGLTKNGAGLLSLSAVPAYDGPTIVNGGGITLGGTPGTSGVTLGSGASLSVEDPGDPLGQLSVPALSLGSGAVLRIETSTGNLSEKVVVGNAGGLSLGAASVSLQIDGSVNGSVSGTYTILEYSGALGGSVSGLTVQNPRSGYSYSFADTGTAITVTVLASDSDNDGMDDDWEDANGLNKLVDDAAGNLDGDFATNLEEYLANTDPQDASSDPANVDNDGLPDDWEITTFGSIAAQAGSDDFDGDYDSNVSEYSNGSDPDLATDFTDSDDDGLPDGWEIASFGNIAATDGTADSDSDLFTDVQEYESGTDPNDASFSPAFARLDHRWSFTGSLADSGTVGGSDAVIQPGDNSSTNAVTLNATDVTFVGGAKADSQWVQLGSNLMPDANEPVTIELWATSNGIQNWSRVFSFHDPAETVAEELYMSWSVGTDPNSDRIEWLDSTKNDVTVDNSINYNSATEYHIVMVIEPLAGNPESSTATWYAAPSADPDLGSARGTFTIANRIVDVSDAINALGRSWWPDNAPSATYDEVRMFRGKLDQWALEGLHDQGADDPAQRDTDGGAGADGLPDAWEDFYFFSDFSYGPDDDPDNDTATNLQELYAGSDPDDNTSFPGDSDADGLPDAWEIDNFGDITAQDDLGDPDGDYEDNLTEFLAATDPNDYFSFTDSDDDFMSDGWETWFFFNLDEDGSGDADGDGFDALAEFNEMGDPFDPLSPGVPDGDGDNDGLPDVWEVENFFVDDLSQVDPGADPDNDSFSNLLEYQATSDPDDITSTPSDINADGTPDQYSFLGMDALGTGILDGDGEGTPFDGRLAGSGASFPASDPNLDLDTGVGTLSLSSSAADINGQVNMENLEAIGIPLSSLGFTGNEDFRVRAHFTHLPVLDGFDQIGAYVGTSTTQMTRAATIGATNMALGVNTNGTADSDAVFGAANTAGAANTDLMVVIERIGGIWNVTLNGNANPPAQPTFLNGSGSLEAGVFVLNQTTSKTVELESFTIVSFGQSSADGDNDGIDDAWEVLYFGSAGVSDGTGDSDGDGLSDLEEFAFHGDPTNGGSQGEGSFSTGDSGGVLGNDLSITVAVRAGAMFGAGPNGEQVATVGGITYTIRGGSDLATWSGTVTHVGTTASSEAGWELHTFRLESSEGLSGKGFLDADAAPAAP